MDKNVESYLGINYFIYVYFTDLAFQQWARRLVSNCSLESVIPGLPAPSRGI